MPDLTDPLPGLNDALAPLGIHPLGHAWPGSKNELEARRRTFCRREQGDFTLFSIVRGPDGALRWHEGTTGLTTSAERRPRAGRAAVPAGRIEQQVVFEKLHDSSQVHAALHDLDARLTDGTRR